MWISALGVQVGEELEGRLAEAYQLNSTAITRCGGTASGTGFFARSHLVHPRAAVLSVTTINETSLAVDADFVVEALIGHVRVDLVAGISFPELEALEVDPEGFLDNVLQRLVLKNKNDLVTPSICFFWSLTVEPASRAAESSLGKRRATGSWKMR